MAAVVLVLSTATAAVVLSALLVLQHFEFRRFVGSRLREYRRGTPSSRPPVTLVVPVKGRDPGMEENLAALFDQDYPDYEVVFVVEDRQDPAVAVIENLLTECPSMPARLVVAGRAETAGQKVHNLLRATLLLPERTRVLAFVDGDVRPDPSWLRILVNRCSLETVGATTGYRWLVPERRTLVNLLVANANGGVAALAGHHSHNMVWGGSWAIRRDSFNLLGVPEAWDGKLTEDVVVTTTVRKAKRRIEFEPGCLCASPFDMTWKQAFQFARRQFLLVRVYSPLFWTLSLLYATILQVGFWGAIVATARLALAGDRMWVLPAAMCGLLFLMSTARVWMRRSAARMCLGEAVGVRWGEHCLHALLAPFSSLFAWTAMVASSLGRSVEWRGIRYRLDRGGRVVSLTRTEDHVADPTTERHRLLTPPPRRAAA